MSTRYERFKQWLAAHDPHDEAGQTANATQCPIAYFLKETTIYKRVRVDQEKIEVTNDKGWTQTKLPEQWMSTFIQRFDDIDGLHLWVTYAQCLDIVAEMDAAKATLPRA